MLAGEVERCTQIRPADLLVGKHAEFRIEIVRRRPGKPPKVSHQATMAAYQVISIIEMKDKREGLIAVACEKHQTTRMKVRRRLKSLYGNIGAASLAKNATE